MHTHAYVHVLITPCPMLSSFSQPSSSFSSFFPSSGKLQFQKQQRTFLVVVMLFVREEKKNKQQEKQLLSILQQFSPSFFSFTFAQCLLSLFVLLCLSPILYLTLPLLHLPHSFSSLISSPDPFPPFLLLSLLLFPHLWTHLDHPKREFSSLLTRK